MPPCCLVSTVYLYDDGSRVELGLPPGCRPCISTVRRVVRKVKPVFEERGGYCVVRRPRRAVLPREACGIIERAARGEMPRVLLLGPPGTGKSMFMKILASVSPAVSIWWKPEENISRWVGETEKKFMEVLGRVEVYRPSLLLIDEGDMVVKPRHEGGGSGDGYSVISANLVNIFLTWLQELTDRGVDDIGVVVSTNKSIEEVDYAVRREGRLTPIYFPAPDAEAVRLLAELWGKRVENPEKLAVEAASFANIVKYLETGELRKYQPKPWVHFYYVDCSTLKPRVKIEENTRLIVAEPPPLGVALAAALACSYTRRPLVVPSSPRHVEDARYTAESMESVLALPYMPGMPSYGSVLMANARVPVILVGREWLDDLPRLDYRAAVHMVGGEIAFAEAIGVKPPVTRQKILQALSSFTVS